MTAAVKSTTTAREWLESVRPDGGPRRAAGSRQDDRAAELLRFRHGSVVREETRRVKRRRTRR